jgi:hypothetical protein
MHSEKRLKIIKPTNRTSANSTFDSLAAFQRALKMALNMNVYTASMKIGLKNDHRMPSSEPR